MRDREAYFVVESAEATWVALSAIAKRMQVCVAREDVMRMRLPPVSSGEAFEAAAEMALVKHDAPPRRWARPPIDRSSFVYFVRASDMIKIGTSTNVSKRICALQTASPVRLDLLLVIPGSADLERELHRKHAKLRSHGEWFRAEPALVEHVAILSARVAKRRTAA